MHCLLSAHHSKRNNQVGRLFVCVAVPQACTRLENLLGSDEERAAIAHGNAERLLRLPTQMAVIDDQFLRHAPGGPEPMILLNRH